MADDTREEMQKEQEELDQQMKELEENPPEKLEDWPTEPELRNKTFGGTEGDHGYEDGPEKKLGPSSLQHQEDGSVTIEGEEVDNPEDYKGEPIPGGPTDNEGGRPDGEGDGDVQPPPT